MRDKFKLIVVGIVLFLAQQVFANDYRVLVLPDNIVTENVAIDSFIYDASAEFFADEIVNILNTTDYINAPTISETRNLCKEDVSLMMATKNFTNKFRTSYNIDYVALKKISKKANARYVLLMTSFIDSQNYILRRTLWDFLNVPGATVVDPAYKISTYAVLVDTDNNKKLWADTYYKTISVCENRIITRGPSPQTEQLQKIKDYSRYLCPQIAQSVQINVLPSDVLAKESTQIDYDLGNIDNVFTKKYRHLGKEYNKVYNQKKSEYNEFKKDTKQKYENYKQDRAAKKLEQQKQKESEMQSKLEVKATPVYSEEQTAGMQEISNTIKNKTDNIKNAIFNKQSVEDIQYPELIEIEIKKKKKNNLFGEFSTDRPELRNYN